MMEAERLAPASETNSEVERETRERGHALLARLRAAGGESLRRDPVTERITRWSMADPLLKTQLFRFIDVLPVLRSNADVAAHLREYLLRPDIHLPAGTATALRAGAHSAIAAAVAARAARIGAHQMARRFIAGSNVREATDTIRRLRRQEMGFTLDILGEAVTSEAEAHAYQQQYLHVIEGLARQEWHKIPSVDEAPWGSVPVVNVSLKLSALYSQFDPLDAEGTARAVKERLRPLLALARRAGGYVHVDMEQYAYKDLTLRIFREVLLEEEFRDWGNVGIVLQAYLRDTERDLRDLRAWAAERGAPVWVRLVKGAYWDYETIIAAQRGWPVPVFTRKWETDAAFEHVTRLLLESHEHLRPAIGSHNVRSVAHAQALARQMGLPARTVEYQVLYGMGDRLALALAEQKERVRVYVPYGELLPGMAYLVRRLLENTANESFLRHSFVENLPEDELLRAPLGNGRVGERANGGVGEWGSGLIPGRGECHPVRRWPARRRETPPPRLRAPDSSPAGRRSRADPCSASGAHGCRAFG